MAQKAERQAESSQLENAHLRQIHNLRGRTLTSKWQEKTEINEPKKEGSQVNHQAVWKLKIEMIFVTY